MRRPAIASAGVVRAGPSGKSRSSGTPGRVSSALAASTRRRTLSPGRMAVLVASHGSDARITDHAAGARMTPRSLLEPARLAGGPLLRAQTDERLVDLVRAGHTAAFEAIVARYRRPLLRYCE